jgi:hypothetical protein
MPTEIGQRYSLLSQKQKQLKDSFFERILIKKEKFKLYSNLYSNSFLEKLSKIWSTLQPSFQVENMYRFNHFMFEGLFPNQILPPLLELSQTSSTPDLLSFFVKSNDVFAFRDFQFPGKLLYVSGLSRISVSSGEIQTQNYGNDLAPLKLTPPSQKVYVKLDLPLKNMRRIQKETYFKNYVRRKHRRIMENVKLALVLINPAFKTIVLQTEETTNGNTAPSYHRPFTGVSSGNKSNLFIENKVFANTPNLLDNMKIVPSQNNDIIVNNQNTHASGLNNNNSFKEQKTISQKPLVSPNVFSIGKNNTRNLNIKSNNNRNEARPPVFPNNNKKTFQNNQPISISRGLPFKNRAPSGQSYPNLFQINKTQTSNIREDHNQTPNQTTNKPGYSFNPFKQSGNVSTSQSTRRNPPLPVFGRKPVTNYLEMIQGKKKPKSEMFTRFKRIPLPKDNPKNKFPKNFQPIEDKKQPSEIVKPLSTVTAPKQVNITPSFGNEKGPTFNNPMKINPVKSGFKYNPLARVRPLTSVNQITQQNFKSSEMKTRQQESKIKFPKQETSQGANVRPTASIGTRMQIQEKAPMRDPLRRPKMQESASYGSQNPFKRQRSEQEKLPSFPISSVRKPVVPNIRQSKNAVWRPSDAKNQKVVENPVLKNLKFSDDEGEMQNKGLNNPNSRGDAFMRDFHRRSRY